MCVCSGRLKAQVKEFMNMRGKLKLVEHVAEGLAQQVKVEMSERERKIREEYEQKMKRLVFCCLFLSMCHYV